MIVLCARSGFFRAAALSRGSLLRERTGRGNAPCQDDLRPLCRDDRHVVGTLGLRSLGPCSKPCPKQDRAQHHLGLVRGECSPDAAPDSAAKRNPGVWLRLALEKALGPKRVRVRVDVGAEMDEGDRSQDDGPARNRVPFDLRVRHELAGDVSDDGAHAKRFLDNRIQILVLAGL